MDQSRRALEVVGQMFLCLALARPLLALQPLRPEWNGPCRKTEVIDVNLGNSSESFVRAAWCQVAGTEPPPETVTRWAERLRSDPRMRRVDVVRAFCRSTGRECKLAWSDPWLGNGDLPPAGHKRVKRDVGAVVMFFFHCPGGVNCKMDWAASHASGMAQPHASLAWDGKPGYYDARNPGFWRRELLDARFAGLQFILPNVYGPDMQQEGMVASLAEALSRETDPVKIGLFDDTWAWGEKWFGDFWERKPDFADPASAASKLYAAKWKPFFSIIPRRHWYLVDSRPLVYFYNSGKLGPRSRSAAVLARMKALFRADFGVAPFLAVDRAYFEDPAMSEVADAKFIWDTLDLPGSISRYTLNGRTLCHAMVRWDSLGRDKPGAIATQADRILSGPERLQQVLARSTDADLLVLATWNDLGEGTAVNRCYDYWYLGRWLEPTFFLRILRQAQCEE